MRQVRTLLSLLTLSLTGCVNVPSHKRPVEVLQESLRIPSAHLTLEEGVVQESHPTHDVLSLNFKRAGPSGTEPVKAEYFRANVEGKAPLILWFPILNGEKRIPRFYAERFVKEGYHLLFIERENDFFKGLKIPERFASIDEMGAYIQQGLSQMVSDYRGVVDCMEKRSEVDPSRIGAGGVSMGGIKAILFAGHEPRVRAVYAALAGADLPDILVRSEEKGIQKAREKAQAHFGINDHQMYAALNKVISADPKIAAKYIDPQRVLLTIAYFDKTVPSSNGHNLRGILGYPSTTYIVGGHTMHTVAFLFTERYAAARHYRKVFNDESLAPVFHSQQTTTNLVEKPIESAPVAQVR